MGIFDETLSHVCCSNVLLLYPHLFSQWFSWFSNSKKRKADINESDGELNNAHPTTETLLDENERQRMYVF